MADSDTLTVHRAFADAMATLQHEKVVLQLTVSDMVLLAGVLAERLRHRHWHDPIRRGLERILQDCAVQLDTYDPVLWQWLRSYNKAFAFEASREEDP